MIKEQENGKKPPSLTVSAISLIAIIAIIIVGLKLNFGTQMAVFCAAAAAILIAMLLGEKWSGIQDLLIANMNNVTVANIIIILVGILVGIWMIGGALPSLIYYGLGVISPSALLPLAFVLCAFTSVCTGTSYGSCATMGLAMLGIGINMGIHPPLLGGAIVSGAYFGDKMSPMSDTTNVAPAMAGTDLYSHITSMLYTTIPATVVTLIIYIVLGMNAASGAGADTSNIVLMRETLSGSFNISPICILPMALVLILSVLKVPAILAMGGSAIISVIFAMLTQGASVDAVMACAMEGFKSDTGIALVDTILSRGGAKSMVGTVYLVMFASIMAAAMNRCGVLDVVINEMLLKVIKSAKSLIVATLAESWLVVLLTGNQTMALIVPGQTFASAYDDFDVDRKVLSRSLEDAGTLASPVVPWSSAALYISGVLGLGTSYIPYTFLSFIVPVFSILCAFTGFGIWNSKGEPMWKKKKGD